MAGKVRVEVDLEGSGLVALMNSQGVSAECRSSDGFHATREYRPGSRVLYRVYGDSDDARIAEADDKVLSRAVSACRS